MTAPAGVRRIRGQAGWRLPAGAVIVDRTSRRGNPFTVRAIVAEHQALGITLTDVDAAAIACRRYAEWLDGAGPARIQLASSRWVDRDWIRDHMHELVGRSLACTCPLGAPCHRDVLLARAELLARHQPYSRPALSGCTGAALRASGSDCWDTGAAVSVTNPLPGTG